MFVCLFFHIAMVGNDMIPVIVKWRVATKLVEPHNVTVHITHGSQISGL